MKYNKSGFEAMGITVPSNRLSRGYDLVKELIGCSTEDAFSIIGKCAKNIERDRPYEIVGAVECLDKDLAKIDLTGRYRLLAVLLTD